jgi:hypothetical protein
MLCLLARDIAASGPAVHVRECRVVLEILKEQDPQWAALAELPSALSYLDFGAISPDLHNTCDELHFGHGTELSYHLLEQAEAQEKPLYRLFALGHLCHQGSDAAMHTLIVATMFASKPIGVFTLYNEQTDARGDSEAIMEVIGDPFMADWHVLLDLIFDLWFDDPEAKQKTRELILWYCETGAAFLGIPTDCELVLSQLQEQLDKATGIIGMISRQQAHDLLDMLLDQPFEDLIDLAMTALKSITLPSGSEPTAEFHAEAKRLKASPIADPTFWDLYEDLTMMGVQFTLDQLAHRPSTESWPRYSRESMICGNLQSIMQFLPQEYAVTPGLLVDSVVFRNAAGESLDSVSPDQAHTQLSADIRFFSSLPVSGRTRGVVRKDTPGHDASADTIVGEAFLDVDMNPLAWVVTPRPVLSIPFVADVQNALGFYVELFLDDDALPWFTTSFDRLWHIPELDFSRPIYRDNFSTYDSWPHSLRVDQPVHRGGELFVSVSTPPSGEQTHGEPISEATVSLSNGSTFQTRDNGLAVFDWVEPGAGTLEVAADGYESVVDVPWSMEDRQRNWIAVVLQPGPLLPLPVADVRCDSCLSLTADADPFGDCLDRPVEPVGDIHTETTADAWEDLASMDETPGEVESGETGSEDETSGEVTEQEPILRKKNQGCQGTGSSPGVPVGPLLLGLWLIVWRIRTDNQLRQPRNRSLVQDLPVG